MNDEWPLWFGNDGQVPGVTTADDLYALVIRLPAITSQSLKRVGRGKQNRCDQVQGWELLSWELAISGEPTLPITAWLLPERHPGLIVSCANWQRGALAHHQWYLPSATTTGARYEQHFESANGHSGLIFFGNLNMTIHSPTILGAEHDMLNISSRVKVRPYWASLLQHAKWKASQSKADMLESGANYWRMLNMNFGWLL